MQPDAASGRALMRCLAHAVRASLPDGGVQYGGACPAADSEPLWAPGACLAAAARHHVVPLALPCLLVEGVLKGETEAAGRRLLTGRAAWNARICELMKRVYEAFSAAGLRVLCVKGPALAARYYGRPGARECEDLDFLLPPAELATGARILLDAGFEAVVPMPPGMLGAHLRAGWGFIARDPRSGCCVEINCGLTPRAFCFSLPFDALWERRVSATVDGSVVSLPDPDSLLLMLAAHGAKHHWDRLAWVADMAVLLESGDLDVSRLRATGRRTGALRMLGVGVLLARRLLGAGGCTEALFEGAPRDKRLGPTAELLEARILQWPPAPAWSGWDALRWRLAMRERTADRVCMLSRLAFESSHGDWSWIRLPAPLFPLYRVVRPVRLAVRAARAWRQG